MPAFFIRSGVVPDRCFIDAIATSTVKKTLLVPSYHYLPYGYTCYTFPNVKYVTEN